MTLRNLILLLAQLVVLFVGSPALSGPFSYQCTIKDFFIAHLPDQRSWLAREAMKHVLTIDRRSGRAFHPYVGTDAFESVILIDRGSSEWAFKSAAIVRGVTSPGSFFRYYELYEYSESDQKPFMAMALAIADGITYSGECR